MRADINVVEIGASKVYVEDIEGDSKYLSYSATKKALFAQESIDARVDVVDNEKAVKFLNTLLGRCEIKKDRLITRRKR